MASITSWTRLEPVPRAPEMTVGLRAELADPLWLLGRQWQFGELNGEDAGSPVESVVTVETTFLSRMHPGELGRDPRGRSVDLAGSSVPLEAMVEQRPLSGTPGDLRLAAEAGQHFLRLLGIHRARDQRNRFISAYPITTTADPSEHGAVVTSWLGSLEGRVPNGRELADALKAHRGAASTLSSLPAKPTIPAGKRARVLAAANDFLRWWDEFAMQPRPNVDSWNPRRLEYGFAAQATLSDGDIVLHADDYRGGRLDWYEFQVDTRSSLGAPESPVPSQQLVRRTMPTRAFYAGMPADRFWEFEDSSVRFGVASIGRTDLAHMLLNEFALAYGNDWYVVPLTVPVGSVCAIRDLRVIDSFGVETTVTRSASTGSWTMYELSPRGGAAARASGLFFLPATLTVTQEGDPVEEVAWFRDEMANLVWAVERRTESPTGGHVDRYERAQQGLAAVGSQQLLGDVGDADLVYRLNSAVPENWHPLVPVRPRGAPAGVLELQLRPIRRIDSGGTTRLARPAGRFLTARQPLVVEEEEIGRQGVEARAQWELARGVDGRYHLWLSNRVVTGRGEGSSGLIFDVARPAH